MKACVQRFLGDARKVSLCADIWTKKGLKSSYLGITAHVFSRYDHRRHQVTLAVRQIVQHPHNAETIREDVLTEWRIPLSKVLDILTDNGNNMVKAFLAWWSATLPCSPLFPWQLSLLTQRISQRVVLHGGPTKWRPPPSLSLLLCSTVGDEGGKEREEYGLRVTNMHV